MAVDGNAFRTKGNNCVAMEAVRARMRDLIRLWKGRPFCGIPLAAGGIALSLTALVPARADWRSECRQIVWVEAKTWESNTGVLRRYVREGQRWKSVGSEVPVTLGRNGLGIGEGLHREGMQGPGKVEGDRKAPAGVFPLEYGFGKKPRPKGGNSSFRFHRAESFHYWVDDPNSRFYNRWIDLRDPKVVKDWDSAEVLARPDGLYDLAIVVGHNRRAFIPGKGSAIFLHRWRAPGTPTIGCTAMDPGHLLRLWEWLDGDRRPVLVQGPGEWIRQLRLPSGFTPE